MKHRSFLTALSVIVIAIFVAATIAFSADPVKITGKSTNTKPTNVAAGSTFYESDTTNTYVYRIYPDGTRAWVLSSTGSATTFYLATLEANQAAAITATAAEINTLSGITATVAELNKNAGVTAGTASASKTAVLGANKNLDEFHVATLYLGSAAGTAVTSTAAEINKLAGMPVSVITSATPGTGSNTAQFTFKNAAGATISRVFSGIAYISDINGAHVGAQTSFAAATNGSISSLMTGKVIEFTTTSGGLLGLTLTASNGSYYVTFVLPEGIIATSTVLTVN